MVWTLNVLRPASSFGVMKSLMIVALCLAGVVTTAVGQSGNLVANAAWQEMQDRTRRQQAEIEDLKALVNSMSENLTVLRKRIVEQNEAMQKIVEAQKLALGDFVSKDELSGVTLSVKEAEKNREADKKLFIKKFEELRRLILSTPTKSTPARSTPPAPNQRGVEHKVESGETLSAIMDAYNAELKRRGSKARITVDSLKKANPGLKPDRIFVGQKIFIPVAD